MKDFAAAAGIPYEILKDTIQKYNKFVEANKGEAKEKVQKFCAKNEGSFTSASVTLQDSFGKTVFPVAFDLDKPIYAAIITPAIHYTMGGLKIDKQVFVNK